MHPPPPQFHKSRASALPFSINSLGLDPCPRNLASIPRSPLSTPIKRPHPALEQTQRIRPSSRVLALEARLYSLDHELPLWEEDRWVLCGGISRRVVIVRFRFLFLFSKAHLLGVIELTSLNILDNRNELTDTTALYAIMSRAWTNR